MPCLMMSCDIIFNNKKMSKKPNLEYVKHVPDFIAKLGLSKAAVKQH
jgi:hypothetical protein